MSRDVQENGCTLLEPGEAGGAVLGRRIEGQKETAISPDATALRKASSNNKMVSFSSSLIRY